MKNREKLFEKQNKALRDPQEILSAPLHYAGIETSSLEFVAGRSFASLLDKLGITLIITREYEHLVMALSAGKKLRQSFISLPHPSGVAVDRNNNAVYVAATRNPNQVFELKPVQGYMRRDGNRSKPGPEFLMPARVKFFPGAAYLHDLAFIGNELHGNSVGQNGILKIDMNSPATGKICWSPKSMKGKHSANHLQLNSIAAGKNISSSFFSASAERPLKQKPGDKDFPVDGTGVIFSGKSGEVCARGLTRPHSARLHEGKLYVNNSGYGEFGFIEHEKFVPLIKLPGWTRGLCFYRNYVFIGVSRVLPKFKMYAPGLDHKEAMCGIFVYDLNTNRVISSFEWPGGNQVFGIEWIERKITSGFIYEKAEGTSEDQKDVFSRCTF
jgi:uncharacterized protein (TIGR03032 family)